MALYIYNSHNIPLRKKGIIIIVYTAIFKGLPWWLSGKESCCNAGDASLIPGPGRSPGRGHGNPLQYSCQENPHGYSHSHPFLRSQCHRGWGPAEHEGDGGDGARRLPLCEPPPPPEQAVQGNIDTPAPRLPPAHLDGVMGVRSFPMVWITRLPHTQRPVQIPTPP